MHSARSTVFSALMCALTAILAQISIPVGVTAVTLQTFSVSLAGYLLGARAGALSMLSYLLLGACGVPVFSLFTGGIGILLGPTGGFLLAFPLMALICGLSRRSGVFRQTAAGLAGLLIVYIIGTAHMCLVSGFEPGEALAAGVAPFVLKDVLSIAGAVGAGRTISGRIR